MTKSINWTEEQIETLKKLYPTCYLCDVADTLGFSTDVVRRKAIALGLQKDKSFDSHGHYGRYVRKGNHLKGMV